MILDIHSTLRVVFTIYAAFWVGALVILFLATGLLLKRAEQLNRKMHGGGGEHH